MQHDSLATNLLQPCQVSILERAVPGMDTNAPRALAFIQCSVLFNTSIPNLFNSANPYARVPQCIGAFLMHTNTDQGCLWIGCIEAEAHCEEPLLCMQSEHLHITGAHPMDTGGRKRPGEGCYRLQAPWGDLN